MNDDKLYNRIKFGGFIALVFTVVIVKQLLAVPILIGIVLSISIYVSWIWFIADWIYDWYISFRGDKDKRKL